MLELVNVSKSYKDVSVLEGVNFKIEKGQSVSVVGASGTGKTTLLNISSLIDVPSSGEVRYFSKKVDVKDFTDTRRKHISFVYQQHNLMPEFTVFENIAIIAKMRNVYDEALIKSLLAKVGLLEHSHKKSSELSGGQKQRASIVRAIASKPDILFADEPTGNLDPESAKISAELLINLSNDQNIAVFIITHNLEIAKMCSQTFEVKNRNLVKYEK